MKTAKIIVCCHKQDVMAKDAPYMPIHVGKALSQVELGIQGDNEVDENVDEKKSISEKNRSYCELTGLYWAWKNIDNADVVGLAHYRRYLDFHGQCDSVMPETPFRTEQFAEVDLSVPQSVIDTLHDGEAYVAKPRFYRHSLFDDYCIAHISDDIRTLEHHIMTTQPENIRQAWYEYMHRGCQLRHYNMFLMTRKDFNAYSEWIFSVLAEMEKQIDITHYSPVQGRIFGYMAERLMNVWLLANNFKLHEQPVIWFTDCPGGGSRSHLKYYRNLLRSKLALAITRGNNSVWKKNWK